MAVLPGTPPTGLRRLAARQRRAADSRAPLRAARDTFDTLGAHPWSERARQELRASGETSRRPTPDARDQLTPQELQIAQLAATGLPNREIAQQLYLSHRTVGSHLYRIFPKLGIRSRAELAAILNTQMAPGTGAQRDKPVPCVSPCVARRLPLTLGGSLTGSPKSSNGADMMRWKSTPAGQRHVIADACFSCVCMGGLGNG